MSAPPDINPPLSTPRLRLEPQVAAHAPVMVAALADPRSYLYIPGKPPTDTEALRRRFAHQESRRSPDGANLWLNWIVYSGQTALGTVQATVELAERTAAVAYVFGPGAWGQGYASESMRAMLSFLHAGLGVETFVAHLDTRNAASRRLVERLGFVQTDLILGADRFKGSFSDEYVYSLSAAAFSASSPTLPLDFPPAGL
ncbi:GNAT family N-acetyltransferase [Deinococcus aquatilis]|jgi:ribosomal-protein-alanine N-acetyltransferase|uniref:GNAT family N-acetyltransferase n=1 Tax=Deinococcus aquatilis TaxID=519440 RepID=UPI00036C3F8F|nr:GNAT family N-acetyltransferase [Deinococcus aquatilis]